MKKTLKMALAAALALALALSLGSFALAEEGFAPDDGFATRGDVIKELYWDYGAGEKVDSESGFTDIAADSGLTEAAAWAVSRGIAKGYGDGTFGPDDYVTREQAVTLLYRYAQYRGMGLQGLWMFQLDYPDAAEVSDWADEAMHWAVGNLVLTERESGLLEPKDHIGVNELPVLVRNMEDAITFRMENEGLLLNVPKNISEKLEITTLPENAADGTLFTVSEQASVDAAKAKGYDGFGMGWLFSIRRIGEEEAYRLLCGDMSGMTLFAKDAENYYYAFCTPTDVRYDRETTEQMIADQAQWTELVEWAWTVPDRFASDNGLTPVSYGNSLADIYLYRAAYMDGVSYTLSTTAFGPLAPAESVNAKEYVAKVLDGAKIEYVQAEAPDGEYVVLNFADDGERFDFFSADGNLIRRVSDSGYEEFYRVTYENGGTNAHDLMEEWYFALAAAHGLGGK